MGCAASASSGPGGRRRASRIGSRRWFSFKRVESVDAVDVLPRKHRAVFLMGSTDCAGANSSIKRELVDSPIFDRAVVAKIFELAAPRYRWKRDDVNKRLDRFGWTELMLAAKEGRTEEARALVNAGAAVDLRTSGGSTALMDACFYGHDDVVKLLLAAGARTDLKANNGFTALKWARDQGHEECARLLRAAGVKH